MQSILASSYLSCSMVSRVPIWFTRLNLWIIQLSNRSLITLIVPMCPSHPLQNRQDTEFREIRLAEFPFEARELRLEDCLEERADITFVKAWSWPNNLSGAKKSCILRLGSDLEKDEKSWAAYIRTQPPQAPLRGWRALAALEAEVGAAGSESADNGDIDYKIRIKIKMKI